MKKINIYLQLFFIISISSLLSSCISQKDLAYFQETKDTFGRPKVVFPNFEKLNSVYEPVIQSNDILAIYVSSLSPEASSFFNPVFEQNQGGGSINAAPVALGYLVDINGDIEIPLVGKVKVRGLTTEKARELIKGKLEKYLQNPTLRIYFQNYRVTVLGEVSKPGVYNVPNEKITLPELLGLAGDMTIYGDRTNLMIIRETDGKKTYSFVDMKKRDLFNSPDYYLHPNDIVYVAPLKGRAAQTDNFYRIAPVLISALSLITVIVIQTGK